MAYSQADIDALKAALATGATEVRYADGRTVKYRTLEDMRSILNEMQGVVDAESGQPSFRRILRVKTCRGY